MRNGLRRVGRLAFSLVLGAAVCAGGRPAFAVSWSDYPAEDTSFTEAAAPTSVPPAPGGNASCSAIQSAIDWTNAQIKAAKAAILELTKRLTGANILLALVGGYKGNLAGFAKLVIQYNPDWKSIPTLVAIVNAANKGDYAATVQAIKDRITYLQNLINGWKAYLNLLQQLLAWLQIAAAICTKASQPAASPTKP